MIGLSVRVPLEPFSSLVGTLVQSLRLYLFLDFLAGVAASPLSSAVAAASVSASLFFFFFFFFLGTSVSGFSSTLTSSTLIFFSPASSSPLSSSNLRFLPIVLSAAVLYSSISLL